MHQNVNQWTLFYSFLVGRWRQHHKFFLTSIPFGLYYKIYYFVPNVNNISEQKINITGNWLFKMIFKTIISIEINSSNTFENNFETDGWFYHCCSLNEIFTHIEQIFRLLLKFSVCEGHIRSSTIFHGLTSVKLHNVIVIIIIGGALHHTLMCIKS